jgi:PIN domain nuclease of toxin-antitoxin system
LPVERHPFDDALAYAAGLLLPVTRSAGHSFGDRACLSLAQRFGIPLLTADRAWGDVSGEVGIGIDVIR